MIQHFHALKRALVHCLRIGEDPSRRVGEQAWLLIRHFHGFRQMMTEEIILFGRSGGGKPSDFDATSIFTHLSGIELSQCRAVCRTLCEQEASISNRLVQEAKAKYYDSPHCHLPSTSVSSSSSSSFSSSYSPSMASTTIMTATKYSLIGRRINVMLIEYSAT